MNIETAQILRAMNNAFYQRNAASFAQTRNNSWRGWEKCLEAMPAAPARVLDVACGTMRFRDWLLQRVEGDADDTSSLAHGGASQLTHDGASRLTRDGARGAAAFGLGASGQGLCDQAASVGSLFEYYGIDSCADLVPEKLRCADDTRHGDDGCARHGDDGSVRLGDGSVYFQRLDVLDALLACEVGEASQVSLGIDAPLCDLVISFGFMHHIPGVNHRERFLRMLLGQTQPGGYVAVSFWQFMNSQQLAERALQTTEEGLERLASDCGISLDLDPNDYLLGWDGSTESLRYCHHFTAEEIGALAESVQDLATVQDRFSCDGRTGDLNGYLVLYRREA